MLAVPNPIQAEVWLMSKVRLTIWEIPPHIVLGTGTQRTGCAHQEAMRLMLWMTPY